MMSRKIRLLLVCALIVAAGSAQVGLAEPNAIEVDLLAPSYCEQELVDASGQAELLWMTGEATVHVFFEGPKEGIAHDDDSDGLDEVQTELVELNLSGISSLGPVHMHLDANSPALGRMEETANKTPNVLDVPPFTPSGTVDSFFDARFVVVINGLVTYTRTPVRWFGTLTAKPAAWPDAYYNVNTVKLVDADGSETGFYFGTSRYRPRPVVEIDVLDDSMAELELVFPDGQTTPLELEGNSTTHVFFELDTEGSAFDDDGDGLDEVRTELEQLNLTGFKPELGVVQMSLDAGAPSHGQMEERTNSTPGTLDVPPFTSEGLVESFFDIFFKIEFGGMLMYGETPLPCSGWFTRKPAAPGEAYEDPNLIRLVDSDGVPTGYALDNTRYKPTVCGDLDHPYPVGDLNKDCRVNFFDVPASLLCSGVHPVSDELL
ncbi:MAG: hypothetical protein ACYS76_14665 [Planctomycetota bacterium]|jgi:hypothetical protein